MHTMKMTLAAALITLGLSLPTLAAETNQPSDSPSPQAITVEAARTNDPAPQQPAQPITVETSRPQKEEPRPAKSPARHVFDLKIDTYDMSVKER